MVSQEEVGQDDNPLNVLYVNKCKILSKYLGVSWHIDQGVLYQIINRGCRVKWDHTTALA
jgi:hypothetical protein